MKRKHEWFIRVPWGKLALVSHGHPDGDPVFLVHGRQDSSSVFDPLVEMMSEQYYYVALDMPGNGLSDAYPHVTNIPLHSSEINYAVVFEKPPEVKQPFKDFNMYKQHIIYNKRNEPEGPKLMRFHFLYAMELALLHLGWDKFIFMGHSMGCEQGLFYNAVYPGRITKMILFDAGPTLMRMQIDDNEEFQRLFFDSYYENFHRHNFTRRLHTRQTATEAVKRMRELNDAQVANIISRNFHELGNWHPVEAWHPNEIQLRAFSSIIIPGPNASISNESPPDKVEEKYAVITCIMDDEYYTVADLARFVGCIIEMIENGKSNQPLNSFGTLPKKLKKRLRSFSKGYVIRKIVEAQVTVQANISIVQFSGDIHSYIKAPFCTLDNPPTSDSDETDTDEAHSPDDDLDYVPNEAHSLDDDLDYVPNEAQRPDDARSPNEAHSLDEAQNSIVESFNDIESTDGSAYDDETPSERSWNKALTPNVGSLISANEKILNETQCSNVECFNDEESMEGSAYDDETPNERNSNEALSPYVGSSNETLSANVQILNENQNSIVESLNEAESIRSAYDDETPSEPSLNKALSPNLGNSNEALSLSVESLEAQSLIEFDARTSIMKSVAVQTLFIESVEAQKSVAESVDAQSSPMKSVGVQTLSKESVEAKGSFIQRIMALSPCEESPDDSVEQNWLAPVRQMPRRTFYCQCCEAVNEILERADVDSLVERLDDALGLPRELDPVRKSCDCKTWKSLSPISECSDELSLDEESSETFSELESLNGESEASNEMTSSTRSASAQLVGKYILDHNLLEDKRANLSFIANAKCVSSSSQQTPNTYSMIVMKTLPTNSSVTQTSNEEQNENDLQKANGSQNSNEAPNAHGTQNSNEEPNAHGTQASNKPPNSNNAINEPQNSNEGPNINGTQNSNANGIKNSNKAPNAHGTQNSNEAPNANDTLNEPQNANNPENTRKPQNRPAKNISHDVDDDEVFGYLSWDNRLKDLAPQNYGNEYYFQLFKTIPPSLLIAASDGAKNVKNPKWRQGAKELLDKMATLENFQRVDVEGSHDVHYTHPERVLPYINAFLKDNKITSKL